MGAYAHERPQPLQASAVSAFVEPQPPSPWQIQPITARPYSKRTLTWKYVAMMCPFVVTSRAPRLPVTARPRHPHTTEAGPGGSGSRQTGDQAAARARRRATRRFRLRRSSSLRPPHTPCS